MHLKLLVIFNLLAFNEITGIDNSSMIFRREKLRTISDVRKLNMFINFSFLKTAMLNM